MTSASLETAIAAISSSKLFPATFQNKKIGIQPRYVRLAEIKFAAILSRVERVRRRRSLSFDGEQKRQFRPLLSPLPSNRQRDGG
jgi:hypothetical protein